MFIILDYRAGNLVEQVSAAHSALVAGIKAGELWGIGTPKGNYYGVKRNKKSLRVYANAKGSEK